MIDGFVSVHQELTNYNYNMDIWFGKSIQLLGFRLFDSGALELKFSKDGVNNQDVVIWDKQVGIWGNILNTQVIPQYSFFNDELVIAQTEDYIAFESDKFNNNLQSIDEYFEFDYINDYQDLTLLSILRRYLFQEGDYLNYINDLNEDIYLLEKVKVNERAFFDEEEKAMKVNEVLESINRILCTTLVQKAEGFEMYNPTYCTKVGRYTDTIKFITYPYFEEEGYPNIETLEINKEEVGENDSTVEIGDVYNQVTVQANLQEIDEEIHPYNLNECPLIDTVFTEEFDSDRKGVRAKYGLQIFNDSKISPRYDNYGDYIDGEFEIMDTDTVNDANTITVDDNIYSSNIVRCATVNYEETSSHTWYLPRYPHPDWTDYIVHNLKKNPIFESVPFELKEYKKLHDCIFHLKTNNTITVDKAPIYITLSGEVLYSKYPFIRGTYEKQNDVAFTKDDLGHIMLYCRVKVGNKYFDGTIFRDNPDTYIPITCDTNGSLDAKTDTWYSLFDTTPYNPVLNHHGFCLRIDPKFFSNSAISGQLEIDVYSNPYYTVVAHGIDGATKSYHSQEFIFNHSILDNGISNHKSTTISIVPYYDYVLLKDFIVSIESSNVDFYGLDTDNADTTYSQEIDELNVAEFSDIVVNLNTYNPDFNRPFSYTYLTMDNKYIDNLLKDGHLCRPEMHIVRQYCDYYSKPRLIHTNTFKVGWDWLTANRQNYTYKVVYLPKKTFLIGDVDYNVKYQNVTIKGYEI
ncbi:MAG: hypothetical protein MJ245_02980 [Clostridia bacterium]|nr:hypothetical protein [Clostridia bacterium]